MPTAVADTIVITKPQRIDIHQRAVPRPMERMGKRSPRRMIIRSADLVERSYASNDHPARRTFAHALHRPRYRALVDVDLVGARSCRCIGSSRRRAGLSYWLWPWSRICRV